MRVCIRNSDGRIIEAQSGSGGLAVLTANAVAAGLSPGDVTVLEVDDATFAADIAAQSAEDNSQSTVIDGVVFLDRVTDEEYEAIMAAAVSNVQIARWIEMVRLVGYVNTASEAAIAAKAGLVAAELLTQERADAIFSIVYVSGGE